MKQATGISASLAAILSSQATIGCCLPLSFAAALGTGAASAFFTTLRPWLLGLSVVLLGLGFWQQHLAKQCAVRGRGLANALLWAAVAVVLGMILFPQQITALIADRFQQGDGNSEEENDTFCSCRRSLAPRRCLLVASPRPGPSSRPLKQQFRSVSGRI